ncbi:MAG: hypothetical protein EA353_09010 [Puniceicoccaceae bacterium]|nr:MAG: hypothetical protein EA353_09010 [Puniceicoccaceae bacterium]
MIRKTHYFIFCLCLLGLLAACKKDSDLDNLKVPRLMVEARGVDYGNLTGGLATLPVSGTQIPLQKEPLVHEFDIANIELVQVEMGLAILIQMTETGARALYRGSVTNMGGRVVLVVNGNAIGARRLDGAIQDGNFYTFVEVSEEEVGQLVLDIRETIVELQTRKNR